MQTDCCLPSETDYAEYEVLCDVYTVTLRAYLLLDKPRLR